MSKDLKPGDKLEKLADDGQSWEPFGTVVLLTGTGICHFTYDDEEKQSRYWTKYKENPCYIWRFNTDGKGIYTYNNQVRKAL